MINRVIKRVLAKIENIRMQNSQKKEYIPFKYNEYCLPQDDFCLGVDSVDKFPVPRLGAYQWCGIVKYEQYYWGIPIDVDKVLKINSENEEVELVGNLPHDEKKWTGAGVYNDVIYGFPRKANSLLEIRPKTNEVNVIALGIKYNSEHHYGGVIYNGELVQPPRDTNHILIINLDNYSISRIYLSEYNIKYRYCGSYAHPNGMIYFLPETGGRVIELSPETREFNYIGKPIDAMVFSVGILASGNLYGFSAYSEGILVIDVKNHDSFMIHKEIGVPGCHANVAVGNKLYGIPGVGDYLWEYNIDTDDVKRIYIESEDHNIAKVASAYLYKDRIVAVPSKSEFGYKIFLKKE